MTTLSLLDFGGEIPSRAPRLLPDSNSEVCETVWLGDGALDTWPLPRIVTALLASTRYVYRIPTTADVTDYNASYYKQFDDPDTKMIKAPVLNDSFERYYWSVPGAAPQYNTKANIIAGSPDYILGLPTPTGTIGVVPDATGSGSLVTYAYVFTYVTAYGEEGPPSPATIKTGKVDDGWDLTLPAVGADATQRNITKRRIYRTITGTAGDTSFFLVVELPIDTLTYHDVIPSTTVAAQGSLESISWSAPPTTLRGLINMPNGIVAGFTGRDIWFSEPYRPHAWPAAYSVTVEHPIVGLGVNGTTLGVMTEGYPVAISGTHPDSMTITKYPHLAPCLSAGSIVSSPQGIMFADPDGLVMGVSGALQSITEELISKALWAKTYQPQYTRAIWYKNTYMSMPSGGTAQGWIVHISNARKAIEKIPMPARVGNLLNDPWTGEPMFIMNSSLYWWDSVDTDARMAYRWKSKEFHHPQPVNYAALKIYFDGIPANSQSENADPWAQQSLALLPIGVTGQLKLWADRTLVWTRNFSDKVGDLMRLPQGYKAEVYQLEVIGRVRVNSIQMGTTVKELEKI